jgi:hypothetical protein
MADPGEVIEAAIARRFNDDRGDIMEGLQLYSTEAEKLKDAILSALAEAGLEIRPIGRSLDEIASEASDGRFKTMAEVLEYARAAVGPTQAPLEKETP